MCMREGGKYLSRLVSKGEHGFLSLCIIRLWFRPRALSDRERRRLPCPTRFWESTMLPRHPIQRASLFRPSIFPSLLRSRVDHLQRNTACGKLKQKAETLTSDRLPSGCFSFNATTTRRRRRKNHRPRKKRHWSADYIKKKGNFLVT